MSTVDKTTGATCVPASGLGKFFVLHNYVDFSVAANYLIQAATMDIFDIPANTLVLYCLIKVATADTDIETLDVGISGGTEDGFYNDLDIGSTGWMAPDLAEGYSIAAAAPYISTSAQVIRITNADAGTLNEAKLHFYALCVDLSDATTAI
jgi:hypothetical protein